MKETDPFGRLFEVREALAASQEGNGGGTYQVETADGNGQVIVTIQADPNGGPGTVVQVEHPPTPASK